MEKSRWAEQIESLVYWAILIVSILGNFMISIALVPFLLTMQGPPLYFSVFFISISFGYFFTFILHGIEKLRTKQHIVAIMLIPAIALINVTIITLMSNKLILLLNLKTIFHSPYIVAGTYVLGYLMPSGIRHIFQKALKKHQ